LLVRKRRRDGSGRRQSPLVFLSEASEEDRDIWTVTGKLRND
jgi:hypothetical protein